MSFEENSVNIGSVEINLNPQDFIEQRISIPISSNNINNTAGIVGILTTPKTPNKNSNKLVVLTHGFGGNKNYCYLQLTARQISNDLGISSFRFDYRGCGDSEDYVNEYFGRTLLQDLEDINYVIDFLKEKKFNLFGIIGHSRGVVNMFQYVLSKIDKNQEDNLPKFLINCSGRYESKRLLAFFDNKSYEEAVNDLLIKIKNKKDYYDEFSSYRFGKVAKIRIPLMEYLELSQVDNSILKVKLEDKIEKVLTIHGWKDSIVPPGDSILFHNQFLNKDDNNYNNKLKHTLKIIPPADHNFYGTDLIPAKLSDSEKQKLNPFNLPVKGSKVNYNYLTADIITKWISNEFKSSLALKTTKL